MRELSRTIGLFAALSLFAGVAPEAAGATLGEQLETIARDGPAGIRQLEDRATRPPDRVGDADRLAAWRGLYVAQMWSDAGVAAPLASASAADALLGPAMDLSRRSGDAATLAVLMAYQATRGYWTSFKAFSNVGAMDEAVETARASGNPDALCLTLIRKGESGWASYATPEWTQPLMEAMRLDKASSVCRAYATWMNLALNGYISGLTPFGADRGLSDGRAALAMIEDRRLHALEDRLRTGMAYLLALRDSAASGSQPPDDIAAAMPQVSRRARATSDGALQMMASVFEADHAVRKGDKAAAARAIRSSLEAQVGPLGRLGALAWGVQASADLPGISVAERAAWMQEAVALLPPGSSIRHRAIVEPARTSFLESTGDYKSALASLKATVDLMVQTSLLEQGRMLDELRVRYDTQAKELENERLRNSEAVLIARRDALGLGLALSLAGLAVVAWLLNRQWRQRRHIASLYGQLENLNRNRSELLAAACHDLRQPAFSLSLLTEVATAQPQHAGRYLDDIRRNSLTLSDMLSELLDLARLERADYPVSIGDVALQPLLDEVQSQYAGQCARKGLSLAVEATSCWVRSDPQLLRRILFNLVSNAVKYTDRGEIAVQVHVSEASVRLTVKDTGRGMPADRIADMLRPYSRMNHDDKEEGLGIGLSVVHRATERLGHGLHIESQPGKGTIANVSLGAPRSPATPPFADSAPAFAPGTCVALVDDNPEVREALAALLRRWGLEVEHAQSGAELQERLDALALSPGKTRPDMLITDYALGAEDGLEIAAAVRQRPGLEDLPVLMVTGSVSAQVQALAEARGVAVLLKPARPSRLRTALQRCLSPKASMPQARASDSTGSSG